MEATDLCVPIYLNQQIVFDLLAVLEDGFSQLAVVKTSATEEESKKSGIGGSIGVSNVFGLLGVSFGGERGREKEAKEQTEVSREKVHTPTSLFAKLRQIIDERKLLNKMQTQDQKDIEKLKGGQFVEFRAVLKKNPLVDTIEGFKQLMQMAVLLPATGSGAQKGGKQGKVAHPQNSDQMAIKQLEVMLAGLTQSNSLEIIGEMLDIRGVKAVLSAKLDYFSDRNASEIIDGEFRVLGKVIRVIGVNSEDSIDLLRKTSFGRLGPSILKQLADSFEAVKEGDIKFPKLVTEIKGPAIQIIPISIFT